MKLTISFTTAVLLLLAVTVGPTSAQDDKFVYADFEKVENGRAISNNGGLVQMYAGQESTPVKFKGLANASPGAPELVVLKTAPGNHLANFEYNLIGPNDWANVTLEVQGRHVVAIDGIGLEQLLGKQDGKEQVLHSFTTGELLSFLPEHVKDEIKGKHNGQTKMEQPNRSSNEYAKITETDDGGQAEPKVTPDQVRDGFNGEYITASDTIALDNLGTGRSGYACSARDRWNYFVDHLLRSAREQKYCATGY